MEIIKELDGFMGEAVLVRLTTGEYVVVSSAYAPFTGPETLAFPADADGNVTSWGEIAGGRGMSRAETLAELEP